MKEITIFITIVILAVVFFVVIEGALGSGANISEALTSSLKSYFKIQEIEEKSDSGEIDSLKKEEKIEESSPKKGVEKKENQKTEEKTEEMPEQAPEEESDDNLSPYFKKIKIYSVQRSSNTYNPRTIKLYSYYIDEEINITGFKIKTRHGEFTIPKGIEKYKSFQMEKNIIIEKNTYINIIEGQSPLGKGINFRENKCLGYLDNFYSFKCPRPKKEDISHLHPYCQNFILRLRSCEIPNYSDDLKISSNSNCTKYLRENLNYSGCFENYSQDKNFLGNNWYIYTNSNIIEPLYDTIYLFDGNGLLIDQYNY